MHANSRRFHTWVVMRREAQAAVAQHIEACAKGMRCGSCMADVGGRNFLILAVQWSFKWVMVKD